MKWAVKKDNIKEGTERVKIRFAFLPIKIGDYWVWLETYRRVEEYRHWKFIPEYRSEVACYHWAFIYNELLWDA